MQDEVIVYGSTWCGYTTRALRTLDALGVAYQYVDVDASPEDEQRIAAWNNGRSIRPTITIGDDVFINPDVGALHLEVKKRGLLLSAKR